jgi:hypothetical protein
LLLYLTHPSTDDLEIWLEHDGLSVRLFDNFPNCKQIGLSPSEPVIFSDSAPESIINLDCHNPYGWYSPDQTDHSLSEFKGKRGTGAWKLRIIDLSDTEFEGVFHYSKLIVEGDEYCSIENCLKQDGESC